VFHPWPATFRCGYSFLPSGSLAGAGIGAGIGSGDGIDSTGCIMPQRIHGERLEQYSSSSQSQTPCEWKQLHPASMVSKLTPTSKSIKRRIAIPFLEARDYPSYESRGGRTGAAGIRGKSGQSAKIVSFIVWESGPP
jgi:hypothetical protein